MRMSLVCQKYKHAFGILATLVITLYIHLWFSKIHDNNNEISGSTLLQNNEHGKSFSRDHIKVVTYNMWCNYLAKSNSNYVERFEGFAKGVKEIDIVLVQEIFILRAGPLEFSNCATKMVDALTSQGFKYRTSVSDTVPYVFGQTNGLVIFSKIPLKDTKSVIYKDSNIRERSNNKGFVFTELLINDKKVTVFNTHTDAHKEYIRDLQMRQLTSVISKYKSSCVIIGGDFNINPLVNQPDDSNLEEYNNLVKTMNGVGLKPVFTEHTKTHKNGGCYDHFFVSSDVIIEERKVISLLTNNGEAVSDHFGLFMKIKLS